MTLTANGKVYFSASLSVCVSGYHNAGPCAKENRARAISKSVLFTHRVVLFSIRFNG